MATYGLAESDPRTVLTVSDAAGKALVSVAMGKKGPDWGSAWTQRPGKSEVLLMQEGAVGRLVDGEISTKDWMNRQPAKMDMGTVTALRITGEVTADLSKAAAAPDAGPSGWTLAKGGTVESAKVAALGSTLSSTYIDDVAVAGKGEAILDMTFAGSAGETKVVLTLNDDKSWILSVGTHLYSMSEHSAKSLRNKARELVDMAKID